MRVEGRGHAAPPRASPTLGPEPPPCPPNQPKRKEKHILRELSTTAGTRGRPQASVVAARGPEVAPTASFTGLPLRFAGSDTDVCWPWKMMGSGATKQGREAPHFRNEGGVRLVMGRYIRLYPYNVSEDLLVLSCGLCEQHVLCTEEERTIICVRGSYRIILRFMQVGRYQDDKECVMHACHISSKISPGIFNKAY